MLNLRAWLPAALLLGSVRAPAADAPQPGAAPPRPRVCLALSGGGARGVAQVGVLRALEENRIPIDCIAGTSMGAVMGALYAAGHATEDLEGIVLGIAWEDVFSGKPDRALVPVSQRRDVPPVLGVGVDLSGVRLPAAALSDYRISRALLRHLSGPAYRAGRDFDRLPIPFRAVATDLRTGERVVLSGGSLERAARASMSIPVALAPVALDGHLLVDGGITDNLPVDVARAMGADVVIAVDTTSPPPDTTRLRDAIGVARQLSDMLTRAHNASYQEPADVTIRPDLGQQRFADYSGFESLMAAGREAALRSIPAIRERLGGREAERRSAVDPDGGLDGLLVTEVRVRGNESLRERVILRAFGLRPGKPLSVDETLREMDALYATGFFESCWLDFEADGDSGVKVVLNVRETERRVAELGLAYDEADEASAFLRLRNRNVFGWGEHGDLMAWAGSGGKGLRWRFARERFRRSPVGLGVEARLAQERPRFFRTHEFVNRARFTRKGADVFLLRPIGAAALVEAGFALGDVDTSERLGLDLPAGSDRVRLLSGTAIVDRLDDPSLPSSGFRLAISADKSPRGLGASRDYWKTRAEASFALGLGSRNVLQLHVLAGASGGDMPVYERFRLGGPVLVPGAAREELWGPQAAALGLSHSFVLRIRTRARLTSRVGAGNVWEERRQMSLGDLTPGLGLGVEQPTRIGPILVGWGIRSKGRSEWYMSLGFR